MTPFIARLWRETHIDTLTGFEPDPDDAHPSASTRADDAERDGDDRPEALAKSKSPAFAVALAKNTAA